MTLAVRRSFSYVRFTLQRVDNTHKGFVCLVYLWVSYVCLAGPTNLRVFWIILCASPIKCLMRNVCWFCIRSRPSAQSTLVRSSADLFVAHDENPHTRPVYVCLCLSYVWRCLSRGPNVTSVLEYFCVSPMKCLMWSFCWFCIRSLSNDIMRFSLVSDER